MVRGFIDSPKDGTLSVTSLSYIRLFGGFACRAVVEGKRYCAVTNVGVRPTVEGRNVTVEPWILDYDGDLNGREITLEFYRFLRPERNFPSQDDLKAEIHRNAGETRAYFGE